MPNKKVAAKKVQLSTKKEVESVKNKLVVSAVSLDGQKAGTLHLPEKIFGQKVSRHLVAQASRVYLNNQQGHFSHTKTRGEVQGSTRKIRAQKGTGGARHGSIRAPIFIGGGIALGPKSRKVTLDLPKKMKRAALVAALSSKAEDGNVVGLTDLEKLSGKTSQVAKLVIGLGSGSVLILIDGNNDKLQRACRNLSQVKVSLPKEINVLDVIKYQTLLLTQKAVSQLESRILKLQPKDASQDLKVREKQAEPVSKAATVSKIKIKKISKK